MKNIDNISVFEEVYVPAREIIRSQNLIIDHFSTNDFAYFHGIFANKNRENGGHFFKELISTEDLSHKIDPEEARKNQLETYEKLSKLKKNQWKDHTYTADNRHTPRIHAKGFGWMQLGRQARNKMFEGYYQADLKSSQMSILVSYLGINEFIDFYKSDKSLWDYLAKETGYSKSELKQKAKQIIYGIPFGMRKPELERRTKYLSIEKILEVDLLKTLVNRRDEEYIIIEEQANKNKGIYTDVLSSKHIYTNKPKPDQYISKNILACIIQSIEFQIMSVNANLFEDINITAWIHDGIIYEHNFLDDLMQKNVKEKALSILPRKPIYTSLEFTKL